MRALRGKRKKNDVPFVYDGINEEDDSDDVQSDVEDAEDMRLRGVQKQWNVETVNPSPVIHIPSSSVADVGIALKRSSDGTVLAPTIRPKKAKMVRVVSVRNWDKLMYC